MAGQTFRRQSLLYGGKNRGELGALEGTAFDRSVRQRRSMTPGIEKNMVAKKTVFDRQKTIVQMAPLQTKND